MIPFDVKISLSQLPLSPSLSRGVEMLLQIKLATGLSENLDGQWQANRADTR